MPKVSIVIPTRNRAHVLKTALASALRQTYEDLEIVVSDNYSTSDTKELVDSFKNTKIRYIRTNKALDMPNSWEFAFHHAKGEYITYLTDDSYLLASAIERALSELERFNSKIVVWNRCAYFAPDWLEPAWRNYLVIPKPTFKPALLSSETALIKFYNLEDDASCPKVLNTLFHRNITERVLQVQGKLFSPPCPDFTAGIALLHNIKEYCYIDEPLVIDGRFPVSIGMVSAFNWGKATQDFLSEFEDTEFTKVIDLNIPVLSISIAQSLEMVRKNYGDMKHTLNIKNLICRCVRDLVIHQMNGIDVKETWQVLNKYLNILPKETRKAVMYRKLVSMIEVISRKNCVRVPFHEFLLKFVGRWRLFRGSRWGITNLQNCGEITPELIQKMRKEVS